MMQGYKNAYPEIKRITNCIMIISKANAVATQRLREWGERKGSPEIHYLKLVLLCLN